MILVLNFKSYFKKRRDYLNLVQKLKKLKTKGIEFWLAINPYFYLSLVPLFKKYFPIGLQNLGIISEKPQTGEVVYDFELINLAKFALIGHSERYRIGENKEIIKEKIRILQTKNLKLLIFFSENSYKPKKTFAQVKRETEKNLKEFLSIIKKENYKKICFVYEPWWAISTEGGKIPSLEFLNDFLDWYKNFIIKETNFNFPIFYGGSFNSKLAKIYSKLNFDGYVLGRASTSIKELKMIIINLQK